MLPLTADTRAIGGTFEFSFTLPKAANRGNRNERQNKVRNDGRQKPTHAAKGENARQRRAEDLKRRGCSAAADAPSKLKTGNDVRECPILASGRPLTRRHPTA